MEISVAFITLLYFPVRPPKIIFGYRFPEFSSFGKSIITRQLSIDISITVSNLSLQLTSNVKPFSCQNSLFNGKILHAIGLETMLRIVVSIQLSPINQCC